MRILYLGAHSILEHDELKLWTELGYDVFSIGAYTDPRKTSEDYRPPLPEVPYHPELIAEVEKRDDQESAKRRLPDALIDWADVIVCAAKEHTYLEPQWSRIRHKRVVWRTIGQSVANNEETMEDCRADGLQIVRYSPKERNIPGYLGEDALIRFYKDPAEWYGWTGEERVIVNFTQAMKRRAEWCNLRAWEVCTEGLPHKAYGPESEDIGGAGAVPYDEMRAVLRKSRAYFYTGTQPASYTLNLIEAMMTGVPIVAIGPVLGNSIFRHDLYEGHELANVGSDDPGLLRRWLVALLDDYAAAEKFSIQMRTRALELFGKDVIAQQWRAFFG